MIFLRIVSHAVAGSRRRQATTTGVGVVAVADEAGIEYVLMFCNSIDWQHNIPMVLIKTLQCHPSLMAITSYYITKH